MGFNSAFKGLNQCVYYKKYVGYQTGSQVNNDVFLLNPIFSAPSLHLKSPQHFRILLLLC